MAATLIGFDSAWVDHPKRPGAICAFRQDGGAKTFIAPISASFDNALEHIRSLHYPGDLTVVAIDQPTIVKTEGSMRPAERVVASVISWSGGGMQPAYTDKIKMFGACAPIWRFLDGLRTIGCVDDPESAATAPEGLFVMEVYPALALLSLDPAFVAASGRRPCYNPANRRRFRLDDWRAVCAAVASDARRLSLDELAGFCDAIQKVDTPRKADQDRLDAAICLLVAARWRHDRRSCAMIGDTADGYLVAPVSAFVHNRLKQAAALKHVPFG